MNEQNQQPIDQTALNLSRAIRKAEGGNYDDYSGDAGTSAGAYQFNNGKVALKKGEVPANFKSWASELNLDPNDFSQTNQDHVVYERIKRKLDSGQTQSSIAAEWNSGLSKGWENHRGTTTINGKKISYDTPGYVNRVKAEYERLSGGGSVDDNNQTDKKESKGYKTSAYVDKPITELKENPSAPLNDESSIMDNLKQGNYGGAIMKGINDITSPFAGLAAIPVQAAVKGYNKLTGSNIPDPYSKEGGNNTGLGITPLTLKDKGSDLLKAAATTGTVAGAGLVTSSLGSGTVLASQPVKSALSNYALEEPVGSLSALQKADAIGNALNKTTSSGDRVLLEKALEELKPLVIKEAGGTPGLLRSVVTKGGGLLKGALKYGGGYAVQKALGDRVMSLYNRIFK